MVIDIRDKPRLEKEDIVKLNFIRVPGVFCYRRHYRSGLRSHIMEVLIPGDVEKEKRGILKDGIRWFPKAKPVKMLRIFRVKFQHLREAEAELRRVKVIENYLAPDFMARSEEFLVDYPTGTRMDFLLCGLQEYVEGEILDPWSQLDEMWLGSLRERMGFENSGHQRGGLTPWLGKVRAEAEDFIRKIRQMIIEDKHVPDLAGVGNLIITPSGQIRLVDINNISKVDFNRTVVLDDRGYPVCDKSVEALALLEQKMLGRPIAHDDPIYSRRFHPLRINKVKAAEKAFYLSEKWQGSS